MRAITLGFIYHDKFPYENQLQPSIENFVSSDSETILYVDTRLSSEGNPAKNYNSMLDDCDTDFLILTHADVTFSPDFIDNVFKTIDKVPDFGALGIVGVSSNGSYKWASEAEIKEVETLDCCCIIINKSHGIRFDEHLFDDFHLYVEDYCVTVNKVHDKKCYTVLTNSEQLPPTVIYEEIVHRKNFFYHHGFTFGSKGAAWGRYYEYKDKLNAKWGKVVKTT